MLTQFKPKIISYFGSSSRPHFYLPYYASLAIYSLPPLLPLPIPSHTHAAPVPPARPHPLNQRRTPCLLRRRTQRHPPHNPPPRRGGAPRHRARQRLRLGGAQCQLRGNGSRHGALVRPRHVSSPSSHAPSRTDGMGWGPSRVRDVCPLPAASLRPLISLQDFLFYHQKECDVSDDPTSASTPWAQMIRSVIYPVFPPSLPCLALGHSLTVYLFLIRSPASH